MLIPYVNKPEQSGQNDLSIRARFSPGQLYITRGISELLLQKTITEIQLQTILTRHLCGDWGDMSADDKQINNEALEEGFRLFSCYHLNRKKVYIITEAARDVTTILLAEEY